MSATTDRTATPAPTAAAATPPGGRADGRTADDGGAAGVTAAGRTTGSATTAGVVELRTAAGWLAVCAAEELTAGRGVAALLPDGSQAALFRDRAGRFYAIGNVDPFTGAGVLSHGLLGSLHGRPYVASPLLKQRFDLADGRCLDDDSVSVPSYPVRIG